MIASHGTEPAAEKRGLGPAVLPVVGFILGIGLLVVAASKTEGIVYTPLGKVAERAGATRFEGKVVVGSVRRDSYPVRFDVADTEGNRVAVEFYAPLPDTFREDREVVVRGRYDAGQGIYLASEVLARCPSKYEGQGYHPEGVPTETGTVPLR